MTKAVRDWKRLARVMVNSDGLKAVMMSDSNDDIELINYDDKYRRATEDDEPRVFNGRIICNRTNVTKKKKTKRKKAKARSLMSRTKADSSPREDGMVLIRKDGQKVRLIITPNTGQLDEEIIKTEEDENNDIVEMHELPPKNKPKKKALKPKKPRAELPSENGSAISVRSQIIAKKLEKMKDKKPLFEGGEKK